MATRYRMQTKCQKLGGNRRQRRQGAGRLALKSSEATRQTLDLCQAARDALSPTFLGANALFADHNFARAHMIKRALGYVVMIGGLMAFASVQAHHSTAGVYDPAKEVKVKGALAKLQFVNPHGSIVVTVKNADGTTTDWTFTTG